MTITATRPTTGLPVGLGDKETAVGAAVEAADRAGLGDDV